MLIGERAGRPYFGRFNGGLSTSLVAGAVDLTNRLFLTLNESDFVYVLFKRNYRVSLNPRPFGSTREYIEGVGEGIILL